MYVFVEDFAAKLPTAPQFTVSGLQLTVYAHHWEKPPQNNALPDHSHHPVCETGRLAVACTYNPATQASQKK
jgi:hypothetical protein